MPRTREHEVKRKLAQFNTLYEKAVERHRTKEEYFLDEIKKLKKELEELEGNKDG